MLRSNLSRIIIFLGLILSCVLGFLVRLFSVVINEEIIHEFDPHFNWRCTQYINEHGLYEFLGWFDNISWYPQGRPVGETAYPGLMFASAIIKWTFQKIHLDVNLISICIYTGPVCSILSTLTAFFFGNLIKSAQLGLLYAAMTAIIPGLISRSVAGGYDYECISLFVIVACFYTFCRALQTGSLFWSLISALTYGYMALTWGGYVFITNCIPLCVFGLIMIGRYSWRLHITYSIWVIFGTLLTSGIPFIHEKVLIKPEHFAIIGVFIFVQIWGLFLHFRNFFKPSSFTTLICSAILAAPLFIFFIVTIGLSTGLLGGFSGRLLQMFDPSYASKKIPIIASVAEHQPTAWPKYFMDCSLFIVLFPVGCHALISHLDENAILLLGFGLSTLYFASIMVRLVLVFTPAMVLISGYGIDWIMQTVIQYIRKFNTMEEKNKNSNNNEDEFDIATVVLTILSLFGVCLYSVLHSVFISCFSYSGDHFHFPVLTPRGRESSDDYREGYRWLWENTGRDDKVESWWDYGYQITSLGGRGCLADGNTNNFTHIGIIGLTMSSPEYSSWKLARMMDVSYMLVIFGGASQYSGDDVNKFLWMPRIANQTFHNISGDMYMVNPHTPIVGQQISTNMSNAAIFKFWYHNFDKFQLHPSYPKGYDFSRQSSITSIEKAQNMKMFEEAFSSANWIVRIYRVKPDPLWDRIY